jgi:hypothetical protein
MKTMTKSMILSVTAAAVLGAGMPSASAGDCEWATAGKILTGVFAGTVLARALCPPPCPTYATTVYTTPTVVYQAPAVAQPAPTVVYQTSAVVQPAPVVVYQAPVVYQTPVMVRPMPMMAFRVGYGGHYPHYAYGHGHGW